MEKRPSAESAAGLTVKAACRDADPCAWRGDDLFLAIRLVNTRAQPVGVPLAYVQKTGPSIRLVDARSGAENQLRTNPADAPERFEARDTLRITRAGLR